MKPGRSRRLGVRLAATVAASFLTMSAVIPVFANEERTVGDLPTTGEVSADAKKGADAAGRLPLAIGLGATGAVLGLVALAVSLAGRRRPA